MKFFFQSDSYEDIFTVTNSASSTPTHTSPENEQHATHLLQSPVTHNRSRAEDGAPSSGTEFIYSPCDIPVDYNEACRMRQRSHSFSQTLGHKHASHSSDPDMTYATSTLGRSQGRGAGEGQGQGRLKEHRRRSRRAMTLANLDHEQLMLILSLQLRYLQEDSAANTQLQHPAPPLSPSSTTTPTAHGMTSTAPFGREERSVRRGVSPAPTSTPSHRRQQGLAGDGRSVKRAPSLTAQSNSHVVPAIFHSLQDYENAEQGAPVDYENTRQAAVVDYENTGQVTLVDYENTGQGALVDYENQGALEEYEGSLVDYENVDGYRLASPVSSNSSPVQDSAASSHHTTTAGGDTPSRSARGVTGTPSRHVSGMGDTPFRNAEERGSIQSRNADGRAGAPSRKAGGTNGVSSRNVGGTSGTPSRSVDGTRGALSRGGDARGSKTEAGRGTVRQSLPCEGTSGGSVRAAPEDSGYMVMQRGHTPTARPNTAMHVAPAALELTPVPATPQPRANSYEDVDNMSACGVPHRDPLYENQKESLAARKLRRKAGAPGKAAAVSAASSSGADDGERPTRPKSYLQAMEGEAGVEEGGISSSTSDDSFSDHDPSPPPHTRRQPQPSLQQGHGAGAGGPGASVRTSAALTTGKRLPDSTPAYLGQVTDDVYAMPNKTGRPLPPRPVNEGQNKQTGAGPWPNKASNHRSAFHKVGPPPASLSYMPAACDTNLDDLQMLPAPRPVSRWSRAPPYSSPPSYECLVASRHGSVHSLASSCSTSHTAGEDTDSDLYKQIRQRRGSSVTNGYTSSHSGLASPYSAQTMAHNGYLQRNNSLCSITGRSKVSPHSVQQQGHAYTAGREQSYHGDYPEVHSFPFRKNHLSLSVHSPYPNPHPYPMSHNASVHRSGQVRSYENMTEVLDRPLRRGQSFQSCQVNNGMKYEDIIHLASGPSEDSDPDTMETII